MVLVGWTFAAPRELLHRLFQADTATVLFTLFGSGVLGWAGYLLVRLRASNWSQPASVTGEVFVDPGLEAAQRRTARTSRPCTTWPSTRDARTVRSRGWCRGAGRHLPDRRRVAPAGAAVDPVGDRDRNGAARPEWRRGRSRRPAAPCTPTTETLVAAAMRPAEVPPTAPLRRSAVDTGQPSIPAQPLMPAQPLIPGSRADGGGDGGGRGRRGTAGTGG